MALAGPTWLGRSLGLRSLSFWSCTDAGAARIDLPESAHCRLVCVGEGGLAGLGMCEGGLAENNNAN